MASKTELFPDDCDPMTTIEGNVSESDCPTVCNNPRISIIFLVSIIICSSLAILSACGLSSSSS
jgi:hypothetical protein